jgi:hypothetical protein
MLILNMSIIILDTRMEQEFIGFLKMMIPRIHRVFEDDDQTHYEFIGIRKMMIKTTMNS